MLADFLDLSSAVFLLLAIGEKYYKQKEKEDNNATIIYNHKLKQRKKSKKKILKAPASAAARRMTGRENSLRGTVSKYTRLLRDTQLWPITGSIKSVERQEIVSAVQTQFQFLPKI